MGIYGEFDERFRPRPAWWRLLLTGLGQLVIAVWITNAAVSAIDMALLRTADVERIWIADATPWSTLRTQIVRQTNPASDFAIRASRAHLDVALWVGAAFLALCVLLLFVWPGRQSLASRLFRATFVQALAAFGAAAFVPRGAWLESDVRFLVLPAGAVVVCLIAEFLALRVYANVADLSGPGARIGFWALRMLPGCALLAVACWLSAYRTGAACAAGLAAVTLVACIVRRPPNRWERLAEPDLRNAAAALPLLAAVLVAASVWAYGLPASRTVVVQNNRPRILGWEAAADRLQGAYDPPRIDIRWSR